MKILLMRHALAATVEQANVKYDAERPLTEEGIEQAKLVGSFLAATNIKPVRILYTPFLRSKKTAELIIEKIGDVPQQASTTILPGAGVDELLSTVSSNCHCNSSWVLVIMHEPDISYILAKLLLKSDEFFMKPLPGDLFALQLDIKNQEAEAQLVCSYSPYRMLNSK